MTTLLLYSAEKRVPQNVTISPGRNGTFFCDGFTNVFWKLENDAYNTKRLNAADTLMHNETLTDLKKLSIFLSGMLIDAKYVSTMTITGNTKNNFTRVACALSNPDVNQLNFSQAAFLRVLGKHDAVTVIARFMMTYIPFQDHQPLQ